MQIASYKFRLVKGMILCSSPGIFIYTHQVTGNSFVRAMRNSKMQRGKANYPKALKDLLEVSPSEVILFQADLPKDTKEELFNATKIVEEHLRKKGVLFERARTNKNIPSPDRFTVWQLKHKTTGFVFYFPELKGAPVAGKINHRMMTFNNYVLSNVVNANRAMYYFVKAYGLTDTSHWDSTDLDLSLDCLVEANKYITRITREHLVKGEVVLSRVNSTDVLYYRNSLLKLPHLSMQAYLNIE